MSLASIDEKLLALFSLEDFDDNLSSIEAKDIKIPPFDASHNEESNEPLIILLRSRDGEKMRFNVLEKIPSKHFWQVGVGFLQ